MIFKGNFQAIKEIMHKSRELGMCTFDQALFELYNKGYIAYEEALRNADSANGLRLQIKLHGGRPEPGEGGSAFGSLSIEEENRRRRTQDLNLCLNLKTRFVPAPNWPPASLRCPSRWC
jgi:hypothetical protein